MSVRHSSLINNYNSTALLPMVIPFETNGRDFFLSKGIRVQKRLARLQLAKNS